MKEVKKEINCEGDLDDILYEEHECFVDSEDWEVDEDVNKEKGTIQDSCRLGVVCCCFEYADIICWRYCT